MADNVTFPLTGTGDATAVAATDEIGGVHFQKIKVDVGAADVSSPLVRGQQTTANSLPVTLPSDVGAIPVTDNSGSLTVDYATTGAGNATGALRVELANNGTGRMATVDAVTAITNVVHVDDNSGSLTVDNGGTFAVQATVAAGATSIAKAEDAASSDGDVGIPAMAIQKATPADTAGTDGDYAMLQMSGGYLWVATVGNVASGAADGGNPVKAGAKYNSTLPTFTNGQRGDLQIGTRGSLNVSIMSQDATTSPVVSASAMSDASSNTQTYMFVRAYNMIFNGTSWDRHLEAANSLNSTGTGIPTAQVVAQFDDTSPGATTENQFGNLRMSSRREMYVQLRDAAGNERGLNVDSAGAIAVTSGKFATVTTTVTRPADTNVYAANDCWSDSTSAPTSGGFTFASPVDASGKSGIITDVMVVSDNDPATLLQGELWIYDSAVTNTNDNAAFANADADSLLQAAVVAFTLASSQAGSGANSFAHLQNLAIGFTCVGTANLRFKVKVKNAYTPASGEKLTFRLKVTQAN